jgi:PAS domain S-box-containing protein
MRESQIRPTGVERTFGEDEIIVSKTDPKGVIRYANGVFLRVSGYEEAAVLGRPHNIIRHPDMPRSVFRLLWDTIASGQEIFAYVLNLAADGAHYWVFAHVTPSFGSHDEIVGYHSNRRLPDRGQIDAVAPIYAALLAEERRHSTTSAAVDAGMALLHDVLRDRAQSYDEFVWSLGTTTPAMAGAAR